ncbi:hypothetical protein LCGC14_2227550 [marine sediment metagenome]|uniref:Glycosyltransferase 2-like domain-containing protein n=1 Tax=marine sediment metagenome TaxID=412755 RepID=A0A0F9FLQ1_9ZZZZ
MRLSIIMPGVRVQNWLEVYESIPNATTLPKKEYELVIVSPYDLPPELKDIENVRLIKDKGCPTRCHQLGLLHSTGEFVVWGADDGIMLPGLALDKAFDVISQDKKDIVSLRYGEDHKAAKLEKLSWWHMKNNRLLRRLKHISRHYLLIMIALIRRSYLMEIGGWDCRFEHLAFAAHDLSYRIQRDGGVLHFSPLEVMNCDWTGWDNTSGTRDHAPVHESHSANDQPLFTKIYKPDGGINRTKIDFDNWKSCPDVWVRRWPNGVPK